MRPCVLYVQCYAVALGSLIQHVTVHVDAPHVVVCLKNVVSYEHKQLTEVESFEQLILTCPFRRLSEAQLLACSRSCTTESEDSVSRLESPKAYALRKKASNDL